MTPEEEVWHELVLAGVGGRTIAEAKERLTYQEARQWFSYIAKRGSLNIGRRMEQSAALMLYSWFRSHGTNAEIEDF
ncbi:hypothetical protein C1141_20570, partial [Vibrio agarivorans]